MEHTGYCKPNPLQKLCLLESCHYAPWKCPDEARRHIIIGHVRPAAPSFCSLFQGPWFDPVECLPLVCTLPMLPLPRYDFPSWCLLPGSADLLPVGRMGSLDAPDDSHNNAWITKQYE